MAAEGTQQQVEVSRPELMKAISFGLEAMDRVYWSPTLAIWLDRPGNDVRAVFDGKSRPPWWVSANAVELVVDAMNLAGSSERDASLETLYGLWKDAPARLLRMAPELKRRGQWSPSDEEALSRRLARPPGRGGDAAAYYTDYQNEYLDDSGWWAVAWLKMYDRSGDPKFLRTARTIHAHMAKNWRPDKGGGVLWCEDEDKQRPNSITNTLFLILSARLYSRTHEDAYLGWAEKTLGWMHEAALYDGTAVVDGPGHKGDYWSYNQGAFVGGLVALYESTLRRGYLDEAAAVAGTVLHQSGLVLPTGVFVEKIGTDGDATLFKGIMARYFGQLVEVLRAAHSHPEVADEIERDLRASAASILAQGPAPDGLYRAEWQPDGKDQRSNFSTQISALIAFLAAARL